MGKRIDEDEKMRKTEAYNQAVRANRHPTFLQDLLKKEKVKKVKNVNVKPNVNKDVNVDNVWTPTNPVTEDKLKSGSEIFKTDMKKKIWG